MATALPAVIRRRLYPTKLWWTVLDLLVLSYPIWMLAALFGIGVMWVGSWLLFTAAAALWIVIPLCFVAASPIYAVRSAKAYEERRERWFIIFTQRPPHRLRARSKGARLIDFVGYIPPGKTYTGVTNRGTGLTPEEDAFWKIVDVPGAEAPTSEHTHKLGIIRLWVRYINVWTDASLVGVRFLFDVHDYPIEKYRLTEREIGGKLDFAIEGPKYTPETGFERSDHVRTAPFRWVVYLPAAETTGGIRFRVIIALYLRTVNPMLQLRNQESWSQFVNTAIVDAVTRAMRSLSEEQIRVLAGKDGASLESVDPLITQIRLTEQRLRLTVGLEIDDSADVTDVLYSGGVQIVEIEPEFRNDAERDAFTAEWRAKREAAALQPRYEAEAKGEALVTQMQLEAMAANPQLAGVARQAEALERAAEKGAGVTIVQVPGGGTAEHGGTHVLLTQMLAELQKMTRGK